MLYSKLKRIHIASVKIHTWVPPPQVFCYGEYGDTVTGVEGSVAPLVLRLYVTA